MAPITGLPNELLILICSSLDRKDQAVFARSCHFIYQVVNDILYDNNVKTGGCTSLLHGAKHNQLGTIQHAVAHRAHLDTTFPPTDPPPPSSSAGSNQDANADSNQTAQNDSTSGAASAAAAGNGKHPGYTTALTAAITKGYYEIVQWLLANGADIHSPTLKQCDCYNPSDRFSQIPLPRRSPVWRALHTAICLGRREIAELLIAHGADVHNVSHDDEKAIPALHCAAQHGAVALIKLLALNIEVDVNELDHLGNTALHYAASYWPKIPVCAFSCCQMSPIAKLLILGADIDAQNQDGFTPMFFACWRGNFAAAQLLLQAGANPDPHRVFVPNYTDLRPMYYCLLPHKKWSIPDRVRWERSQVDVLEMLIARGADVSVRFNRPWRHKVTPLMVATKHGHLGAIQALFNGGASVHDHDERGRSALHVALYDMDTDIFDTHVASTVELLMANGGRLDLGDTSQGSPLVRAVERRKLDPTHVVFDTVVEKAQECNVSADSIRGVLKTCAEVADADAVQQLLGLHDRLYGITDGLIRELVGITIKKTHDSKTLDIILSHSKRQESNELLLRKCILEENSTLALTVLQRGVAVSDVRLWSNQTFLHLACRCGDVQLVEALLERGADPNMFDKDYRTPLHIAVTRNHMEVIKALLKEVADPFILPPDEDLVDQFPTPEERKVFRQTHLTAFDLAIQNSRVDFVMEMLDHYALPDIPPNSTNTYLHRALRNMDTRIVEELLLRGADPNGGEDCRDPPLPSLLYNMRQNPSPPDFAARVLGAIALLYRYGADNYMKGLHGEDAVQIIRSIEKYDGDNWDMHGLKEMLEGKIFTMGPNGASRRRTLICANPGPDDTWMLADCHMCLVDGNEDHTDGEEDDAAEKVVKPEKSGQEGTGSQAGGSEHTDQTERARDHIRQRFVALAPIRR